MKMKVGEVLETDSHRADKSQGTKAQNPRKAGDLKSNPIDTDNLFDTINLADGSEEDQAEKDTFAERGVGDDIGQWTEWEGDIGLEVREKIDSNPTNHGSKVFHLRRVVSSCKATCHGVLRDEAGKERRILGKRKRCGKAVTPGSIQPGYYGEITYTKDHKDWLARPGFVWFCGKQACVEKRHQET